MTKKKAGRREIPKAELMARPEVVERAEEFRAIRLKLALTQKEFAKGLGVSWNDVARKERCERQIPESLLRLARMWGADLDPRRFDY